MRAGLVLCLAACTPSMPMPDGGSGGCNEAAKTPANLVTNGGFECGDALEWSVQFGDFAVVGSDAHGGAKAGQLTAGSTGAGQFGHADPVVQSASGKAYCINAWVRGTATDMRLEVLDTSGGMATAFSSPVQSTWLQAPASSNLKVQPAAGATLYVRLKILNGVAGQTLIVDDVDLWESTAGTCTERH